MATTLCGFAEEVCFVRMAAIEYQEGNDRAWPIPVFSTAAAISATRCLGAGPPVLAYHPNVVVVGVSLVADL